MFGSGNGLATGWWQAITWTNDDKIFVYMVSPGLNDGLVMANDGLVMANDGLVMA